MGLVKNRWRKPAWRIWTPLLWICPFLVVSAVFVLVDGFSVHETAPAPEIAGEDCEVVGDEHELLVTGYCNCGKCCGWRKKWFFFGEPVYDYGNLRGTPKKVGVTASGVVAAKGTIAADPTVYPFGTRIWIPGYGSGTVQDIGGSIKGAHIDIWFPSHVEALAWGARKLKVKVAKKEAKEKQMGRESAGTGPAKR